MLRTSPTKAPTSRDFVFRVGLRPLNVKNLYDVTAMALGRRLRDALDTTAGGFGPSVHAACADPSAVNAASTLGHSRQRGPVRALPGSRLGRQDACVCIRVGLWAADPDPDPEMRVYFCVQICTEVSCNGGITRAFS